jgi:AcrR family transcriptional regulator
METNGRRKMKKSASRSRVNESKSTNGNLSGARARDREVVDAAVRIFWEKGYASASVQDVADALGMLKGSLYYYIDSKESLLEKIFQDSHVDLMRLTQQAVESDAPAVDRLVRFLHDYAMWTLTHIQQAGLYSREWRYATDPIKATLTKSQRYYDQILRELIIAGQHEGSLESTVDPQVMSRFIWAAFTALPDWYRPNRKSHADDVARKYVELALLVCGGAVPPSQPKQPSDSKRERKT